MTKETLVKEKPALEIASVRSHFEGIAKEYDYWKQKNAYYYEGLKRLFRTVIPPGAKVLEVGCGTGEMLHAVSPLEGLGIDLSEDMVRIARSKYPHLSFEVGNIETFRFKTTYEYVIMSDLMDHLPDIWKALYGLEGALKNGTVLVISTINPLWDPLLLAGEKLRMKMPEGPHNFVPAADLAALLALFGYHVREAGYRMPLPVKMPLLSRFLNRWIPRIPVLRRLGVVQYLVAEKRTQKSFSPDGGTPPSVSVIIPSQDNTEEVEASVQRIPPMGSEMEVLIVPYGSADGSLRTKGEAMRHGFEKASGEILMVLEPHKGIPPEELHKFYWVLERNVGFLVNGTRMVYPRENESLRTLHLIGNKLFGILFSRLLGQRVTDTLCSIKALWKKDYLRLQASPLAKADSRGDFDLLFRASESGLKIVEIPVSYKGTRKGRWRSVFRNGCVLLIMGIVGLTRLKYKHVRHQRES